MTSVTVNSKLMAEILSLRPANLGRQAHQDGLDIAAGLQAEQRATVVDQVELHVAAAADQLVLALRGRPGLRHVAADEAGIDLQERLPDIPDEAEIGRHVAGKQMVEENPAGAARLAPMRQVEVTV